MSQELHEEVDFFVNAYEGEMDIQTMRNVYERIFRTKTGKRLIEKMYFFNG